MALRIPISIIVKPIIILSLKFQRIIFLNNNKTINIFLIIEISK